MERTQSEAKRSAPALKSYTKPALEKRAKLVDVAEQIVFVSGVEVVP